MHIHRRNIYNINIYIKNIFDKIFSVLEKNLTMCNLEIQALTVFLRQSFFHNYSK